MYYEGNKTRVSRCISNAQKFDPLLYDDTKWWRLYLCSLLTIITFNNKELMASHYVVRANTMMTSSNGNIFRVTGHLCGELIGPR